MQRIILDTNVLVSGLIQKSYPNLILEHCIAGKAIICLSNDILREYVEVLNRPKFSKFVGFKTNADFFIARLLDVAEFYEAHETLNVITDEADNRFLELAATCNADFIITGNSNDFIMSEFKNTKIVSPKEFWDLHV
jgi:putative PIN family toxin of toxin-antitoxin system